MQGALLFISKTLCGLLVPIPNFPLLKIKFEEAFKVLALADPKITLVAAVLFIVVAYYFLVFSFDLLLFPSIAYASELVLLSPYYFR